MLEHVDVSRRMSPAHMDEPPEEGMTATADENKPNSEQTAVEIGFETALYTETVTRHLPNKQVRKCMQAIGGHRKNIQSDLHKAPTMRSGVKKVWEIYAGESLLTKTLQKRGLSARSFGLHNGR